jgi:hypothetical protein
MNEIKLDSEVPTLKVGDEMLYFPHALYAKEQNSDKTYPWVFGWSRVVHNPDNQRELSIEIQELTHKQLEQKLEYLARHSDPSMERKRLVPMRPLDAWRSKVTAVNGDGTVDLDVVVGTRSGVTLSMRGINVVDHENVKSLRKAVREPGGSHPASVLAHTCHAIVPQGTNT